MEGNRIEPNKVTRPIQLVAAWLVGLVLVNGAFLGAAHGIESPVWLKATLVIAAILNVPVFLFAIFLLQTKFRPELQEDAYYSQYLNNATNEYVTISKDEQIISLISDLNSKITLQNNVTAESQDTKNLAAVSEDWAPWKVALSDLLPNFEEIRARLKSDGISIEKIFGSANTNKTQEVNVIGFSRSVDFPTVIKVLRKMVDYEFDGYCYSSVKAKMVNREEIYLGGFGYMNGGYFPINEELKELLKTDLEKSDLEYFESKNPLIKVHEK